MLTIFVVSDATGRTAERLIGSALAQFGSAPVEVMRRRAVRTPKQVRAVVLEAAACNGLIVHTLVADELRRLMLSESRLHDVDSLDVIGPVLERLATHLDLLPEEKPGLVRQLTDAHVREIEAVDFAFRHDDGRNVGELKRAEVVLVGISRTMKTPTMLYLAYRGWFAANVPLVPEVPLPKALVLAPPKRVFCLLMNPGRLRELRITRATNQSIPVEPYASVETIRSELRHARTLALKHRWQIIEVTGKSVEEVSREIIALLPRRV